MTDRATFDHMVVGGRSYTPLLILDADGRRAELKLPSATSPTGTAVIQPWLCSDCAALTTDPAKHNELHDGPACEVCGCTEDCPCTGGCWWADDRLCSRCTGDPADPDEWPCICGHPNLDHDVDGHCTVTSDDPNVEWAECPCRGIEKTG